MPGDIIRYGNDHIGLIAAVDAVGMLEAKSIYELLECLKVTESTYGGDINNTFKRVSTDGAVYVNATGESFNKGSWLYDWKDEKTMRNFVIERLK